ncbi:hypothetical protein QQF64_002479 [Cirrhinus molitorella]|uniref:Uncharacterized protein n=1 Tax=Cirrhinus molitorella TaxID=172907 RepID=A0ABR3MQA1_9TELE
MVEICQRLPPIPSLGSDFVGKGKRDGGYRHRLAQHHQSKARVMVPQRPKPGCALLQTSLNQFNSVLAAASSFCPGVGQGWLCDDGGCHRNDFR